MFLFKAAKAAVCCLVLAALFGNADLRSVRAVPGDIDSTFNPGVIGTSTLFYSAVVQPDGKIVIGGGFINVGGTAINRIARLNPNGSLDTTFSIGNGADNNVRAIIRQSDGKYLIAGDFLNFNGVPRGRAARLNADGTLDTTFDTSGNTFNGAITSIAPQADGKFIIAGFFTNINGTAYTNVARLNANGSLDTAFNPVISPTNNFTATFVLAVGDKVYVGGAFTTFAGESRNRLVRLDPDGTIDTTYSFVNGANNSLFGISPVQADGKFYVYGNFTAFAGETRNGIARLNADGSLDTSFPGPPALTINAIYSATTQSDGKVLIGGNFTAVGGVNRQRLARLNANGTLDLSFNPGSGLNIGGTVYFLSQQADGKILVGGFFSSYNGIARTRLIRLLNTGVGTADFSGDTATDVSVYRGGNWFVRTASGGFTGVQFGASSDTPTPGDFDGDSKIDYSVYRAGTWYVLRSSDNVFAGVQWGSSTDLPFAGDYTGDGKDDFTVYRAANGFWYVLPSAGGDSVAAQFGAAEDVPLVGDFDGDGATNLAVFRPSNGTWYYALNLSAPLMNIVGIQWGAATDKPVPADYDGDGQTDAAVFRASDQTWYVRRSSDGTLRAQQWGAATDKLVPGDYDGDNKDDFAVYRDGNWYISQSSNNALRTDFFGAATDVPVPASYLR